jgi:hypothetical protein
MDGSFDPNAEANRKAKLEELQAGNARAQQAIRAKSGLAGMGLTGAGANLEATSQRQGTREATVAMDEYDAALRKEQIDRIVAGIRAQQGERDLSIREQELDLNKESNKIAVNALEIQDNFDHNRDGKIGGKTPEEIKADKAKAEEAKATELQGAKTDPVIVDVATRMRSRYPDMFKDQAGAEAAMTAAKTAFASWSPKNPGVTFEQYVQNHLDYWSGPGGYLTRGVTLGMANETNWPT